MAFYGYERFGPHTSEARPSSALWTIAVPVRRALDSQWQVRECWDEIFRRLKATLAADRVHSWRLVAVGVRSCVCGVSLPGDAGARRRGVVVGVPPRRRQRRRLAGHDAGCGRRDRPRCKACGCLSARHESSDCGGTLRWWASGVLADITYLTPAYLRNPNQISRCAASSRLPALSTCDSLLT